MPGYVWFVGDCKGEVIDTGEDNIYVDGDDSMGAGASNWTLVSHALGLRHIRDPPNHLHRLPLARSAHFSSPELFH